MVHMDFWNNGYTCQEYRGHYEHYYRALGTYDKAYYYDLVYIPGLCAIGDSNQDKTNIYIFLN